MHKLSRTDVFEWMDYLTVYETYENLVTVAGIQAGRYPGESSLPVRMNQFSAILALRGTVRMSLDYIPYTVPAGHLLLLMPSHIIQIVESSDDFDAKVLVLNKGFLDGCEVRKHVASALDYMQFYKNPCIEFTPGETAHLERCFLLLEEKIKKRTHAFYRDVIQNSVFAFLLEMANILVSRIDSFSRPVFSRKEELTNQFVQLLLQHAGTHHLVTFYADKLNITPQYLSMVLKEVTGKSANRWIDDVLTLEAKTLLKAPRSTVQQVADKLNFSDQSAFGKFFKKNTGLSPREYRKS
ncbi:MAG: helix-turn-helix domain-containing protein [Tannerella sp.]|nr:helix-turn-helix domain-containing protein [Tannerella sp.]